MLKAESFHGFQLWASVTWRCSMEFLCTRPSSVWYEVTNLSFSFQWCCKISGFNHPLLYLQTGNAAGFLLLFQDWSRQLKQLFCTHRQFFFTASSVNSTLRYKVGRSLQGSRGSFRCNTLSAVWEKWFEGQCRCSVQVLNFNAQY